MFRYLCVIVLGMHLFGQSELCFIDENEPVKSWEYAVLVCNAHYDLQIGRAHV